jgi:AmpD protein
VLNTDAKPKASEVPPASPLWQAGWYRYAHRLDSPNFGARPAGACIDLVVIHSISLPPGEFGKGCVQALFTNTLDWNAHPYFKSIQADARPKPRANVLRRYTCRLTYML